MSGVRTHRRTRDDPSVVMIEGIPATDIERTIIDLSGVLSARHTALAVDDALRRGLTTVSRLSGAIDELGTQGRRGTAALRAMLTRRDVRDERAESRLEAALLRVLRRRGVPLPVSQYQVMDGNRITARIDFAYPSLRLGIEADGYRWHGGRQRWSEGVRRENRLKLRGWTLLRFTWEDVHNRPELVASQIRAALQNLAHSPTLSVGE